MVAAFDAATVRGERCAVATVVSVAGSSYRRPGARMLVGEAGTRAGTISAGCLESDVIAHAQRAIRTSAATLAEYNTTSGSDEMAWGLGLGCNGIVRVLVEPVGSRSLYLEALRRSDAACVSVATVYQCAPSERTSAPARPATVARLVISEEGDLRHENMSGAMAAMLESEVRALTHGGGRSAARSWDVDGVTPEIFIETLRPPIRLVVFGAGPDALPVVEFAHALGWRTEVVDPQARPGSRSRFAAADRVVLSRPEDVGTRVSITPRTMTLLMSHDYAHDLVLLRFLLASPARYIGVVGPRTRTERMLRQLAAADEPFRREATTLERVHAPAGLDIGADGPAEIALSIVAEMRALLDGRRGGLLRERRGSIHGSPADGAGVASTDQDRPVVAP